MKIKTIFITIAALLLGSSDTNAHDRIIQWAEAIPCSTSSPFQDVQEMLPINWFVAASEGNSQLLQEYLSLGFDVNTTNAKGRTALHQATLHGHVTCVKMLLNAKAFFDLEDEYCSMPFNDLAAQGYCNRNIFRQILQLFIAAGFKIDTQNSLAQTALHLAVLHKKVDYVAELVNAGADVNITDLANKIPLELLKDESGKNVFLVRKILTTRVSVV